MGMVSIFPGVPLGCAFGGGWPLRQPTTNGTMDAAGESVTFIGSIQLSTGPGTSATLSTGSISFRAGGVTFANAGTTVRAGLQDVASTGLEDGTYDVYGEVVGGGGGISATSLCTITMTSGTKTVTHGDLIAIVIEMTAKGGTDSVIAVIGNSTTCSSPYCTLDTGTGPARQAGAPLGLITFDNGAIGFFGESFVPEHPVATSFNVDSTPDEYALIFSVPFRCQVSRLTAHLSDMDTGDDGELILYSNPLGAPVAERTVTIDADYVGQLSASTVSPYTEAPIDAYTLEPHVLYAIAHRPTTTGNRTLTRRTIVAGWRAACWLGTSIREGSRTGNSGAFSETTTSLPALGAVITAIEDGVTLPRTRALRREF